MMCAEGKEATRREAASFVSCRVIHFPRSSFPVRTYYPVVPKNTEKDGGGRGSDLLGARSQVLFALLECDTDHHFERAKSRRVRSETERKG